MEKNKCHPITKASDYAVNYRVMQVYHVKHTGGTIKVEYAVFPYYTRRVSIYKEEEFLQWIMDTHQDNRPTFDPIFFAEEFPDIIANDIDQFHYEMIGGPLQAEVRRLSNIIDALERMVCSLRRRLERVTLKNIFLINNNNNHGKSDK